MANLAGALVFAGAAVFMPWAAFGQDPGPGVVRVGEHLAGSDAGQRQYRIGEEQRDVFPVVDLQGASREIPVAPDGSVPLRRLLDAMELPAGTGWVTVQIQAGGRTVARSLRLDERDVALPLYADAASANQVDNAGFDQYSETFAPIGWSFDVVSGHGAVIRGTASEPDGRPFTMELLARPDGADSLMWQTIPLTAIPAGGTAAQASLEAWASAPNGLILELVAIGLDRSERVLASAAHPGHGAWATLHAAADLSAAMREPILAFRVRRAATAEGRTAFDDASLVVPGVFRRHASVTVASGARQQYRTQALTIPAKARLEFGLGLAKPFGASDSRAVTFRVKAMSDEAEEVIFERAIAPGDSAAPVVWQDQGLDVSAWGGRSVRLEFETEYADGADASGPDSVMPLWGEVVIEGGVPPGEPRPNLILISLDTLRADHLGAYGYARPTSPALDRLASSAYVFENAFSSCSWTTPAHATAFTGLLPSVHGAGIRRGEFAQRGRLPDSATTFAERAQAAGYRTAAFTEGYFAGSRWGLGQGFDRYHDGPADPTPHSDAIRATIGRASAWLDETGPQPFLLFVHTYATHWPYAPPEPYRSRFLTDPKAELPDPAAALAGTLDAAGFQAMRDYYDGGIAHMDHVIGEFLADLSARGVLDTAWVIIFSDHGEEFGEHGKTMHGFSLYDEVLHIPFIVRPPRGLEQTQRIADVVALADLFGTVLGILGDTEHALPASSVSLLPLMTGGPGAQGHRSAVIGELMQHQGRTYFISSRDDAHKYIVSAPYGGAGAAIPGTITETEAGFDINYPIAILEHARNAAAASAARRGVAEEVYVVRDTPRESENIAGKQPAQTGILRDALSRRLIHIRDTAAASVAAPDLAAPLSPEEIEKLKAIGYVEETGTPTPQP